MKLESISPSDLNRFSRCPRNWFLNKKGVAGVAVPEREKLYGRAVHNAIQLYFQKIPDNPTAEDIEVTAQEAFEEGRTYAMKGFKAKTKRIVENFVAFEKKRLRTWREYKPSLVEKWMEAKLFEDLPPFRAIIDFYGDGVIVDWKTGKAGRMGNSNLRQGKVYEMVLRNLGYDVKKVSFFNLDLGTNLEVPRVTDGWIYKVARRMMDMVEAERFPKNPSGLCTRCQFQLDCEFDTRCLWWGI